MRRSTETPLVNTIHIGRHDGGTHLKNSLIPKKQLLIKAQKRYCAAQGFCYNIKAISFKAFHIVERDSKYPFVSMQI